MVRVPVNDTPNFAASSVTSMENCGERSAVVVLRVRLKRTETTRPEESRKRSWRAATRCNGATGTGVAASVTSLLVATPLATWTWTALPAVAVYGAVTRTSVFPSADGTMRSSVAGPLTAAVMVTSSALLPLPMTARVAASDVALNALASP